MSSFIFAVKKAALCGGGVGVQDQRKSIDRLAGDQHVELDQLAFLIAGQMIIERSVALRDRFQPVVKIEHDLVQRQFVDEHHAVGRDVFKLFLHAAFFVEQRQDAAEKFVVRQDRRLDERLFDL